MLNYLGYSWIDQRINLDEGMKMIKRAVDFQKGRPIRRRRLTSWTRWMGAYYRIGNYEDAVEKSRGASISS